MADGKKYGLDYYVKGALAGGICCSVTHGAMCPVDVVKTRIQLDPATYNKGMIGGFKQVNLVVRVFCFVTTRIVVSCCSSFVAPCCSSTVPSEIPCGKEVYILTC